MLVQQAGGSTWSKPSHRSLSDGHTSYPFVFRFGPYRLAQITFKLKIVDLGPAAISGDDIEIDSLTANRALFLKSTPDHLHPKVVRVEDRMLVYPFYSYDRSWVVTQGGFETYLGRFSKVSRKGLKRRTRKLTERSGGALDIRRFDRPDQMSAFHADARIVSAMTFQEKVMDDGIPADPSFLKKMTDMASIDQCYGSILYLDDQPISYLYCERQAEGWLASYGGFDPAYACWSPGTVHLLQVLQTSFDEPNCALFDFGPGRCDYKQFFSTHDVPCSDLLVLDKTIANRLVVGVHRSLSWLADHSIGLAESLRLKNQLRQKLRGR